MMEFEEEHEEEEEEEEESEMAIITFKNQPQQTTARYRECLKNHAAGIGGHAVDGCGEFMPAGAEGTLDALRCAACNCHRNFHHKEFLLENSTTINNQQQLTLYPPPPHPHQINQFYPYNRTTAGYFHVAGPGQRPLASPSPTAGGTQSIRENHHHEKLVGRGGGGDKGGGGGDKGGGGVNVVGDNNNMNMMMSSPVGGGTMSISGGTMLSGGSGGCSSSGKKRFRTKFTQEQKDKMLELAEKLGWRIQRQDEVVVQQFCHETGVKRHVLKVWMHNNKHTLGKKP